MFLILANIKLYLQAEIAEIFRAMRPPVSAGDQQVDRVHHQLLPLQPEGAPPGVPGPALVLPGPQDEAEDHRPRDDVGR